MKFLIFLLVITSAWSLPVTQKDKFNSIFDYTLGKIAKEKIDPNFTFFKTASRECMMEKLKLPENGEKKILVSTGVFTILAAAAVCLKNPDITFGEKFDQKLQLLNSLEPLKGKVDCLKQKLYELQPESYLLHDFKPDEVKIDCKWTADTERGLQSELEKRQIFRRERNITQCMGLDEVSEKIYSYKFLVVVYSEPQDAASLDGLRRNLILREEENGRKLFKCLFEKLEEEF
jgi:hypothetical protein